MEANRQAELRLTVAQLEARVVQLERQYAALAAAYEKMIIDMESGRGGRDETPTDLALAGRRGGR